MGKHQDRRGQSTQPDGYIPAKGPSTGNGWSHNANRLPKGVTFRQADGKTAGATAGKASRLRILPAIFSKKKP